jgi:hypothetical protein
MNQTTKAYLCLGAIAVLVVVAQTMDYHDQLRMEAEMKAEAQYTYARNHLLALQIRDLDEMQRQVYARRWRKEHPDLARIVDVQWNEFKAHKTHKTHEMDVTAVGARP